MFNKLVAAIFVNAGIFGFAISTYWGALDYAALVQANQRLQSVQFSGSERQIQLLMHRENLHRINVGFEGVWMGLSVIVTAIGYTVGKK